MTPRGSQHSSRRGFTLVELMVALTGGLFVSLAVFALARDSGRFYQRETRLANATMGALVGFERLRTDIARAGFLGTPNIVRDPAVCSKPVVGWPSGLANLASIQITQPGASTNAALAANGRNPQTILLSGSYASADVFPGSFTSTLGTTVEFHLDASPVPPALARLNYFPAASDTTLSAVFAVGSVVRIVEYGKQYYALVFKVTGGPLPFITLANTAPPIQFKDNAPAGLDCGAQEGLAGDGKATINVVNFVQYGLRNLLTDPQTTPDGKTNYASLYANSAAAPGETQRTELVRVELNAAGNPINGTEDIVAEYAVDLQCSLTAITGFTSTTDPTLGSVAPGTAAFGTFAGNVFPTTSTPELIKSVRVRLGVRSREGDRETDIAESGANAGLFRFGLGAGGGGGVSFARVRTFQADVELFNQQGVLW